MFRSVTIILALGAALFLIAAPALAGGWAVITLDALPPREVNAGETLSLGLMVRQHGQTPVHFVDIEGNAPLVPLVTATNRANGEQLQIEATRDETLGHYTAAISFPTEGEWALTVSLNLLEGQLELEPLTVRAAGAPAGPAPEAESEPRAASLTGTSGEAPIQAGLRNGGLVLIGMAALMAIAGVIERRKPAMAKAGD